MKYLKSLIERLRNRNLKVYNYGHSRTYSDHTKIDVEVNEEGKVVAVWFRCLALPFRQSNVHNSRADSMESMYADGIDIEIKGIDVAEKPKNEYHQY